MMQNKQILFNKIPEGMPQEDTFKIEEIDTPKLESDGVLVQTLYISVDPYMRGRMTKGQIRMYSLLKLVNRLLAMSLQK